MGATLLAGSAFFFFTLALVALAVGGIDRGAAAAVVIGLMFLAIAVAGVAADRRPR